MIRPWLLPSILLYVAIFLCGQPAVAAQAVDWSAWRMLPVRDSGRQEPLDTLARRKMFWLSERTHTADPETGERLDACAWYMSMVLDWYGWDSVSPSIREATGVVRQIAEPDKWDRMPLLRVSFPPLRSALGMKTDQPFIAPLEISQSTVQLPDNGGDTPFLIWAATLESRKQGALTPLEEAALELTGRYRAYRDLRSGRQLQLIPAVGNRSWLTLAQVVGRQWDDTSDATGCLRDLQRQFRAARSAFRQKTPAAFAEASASIREVAALWGPRRGAYPSSATINAEVFYSFAIPLRWGAILLLGAGAMLWIGAARQWRMLCRTGWTVFALGILFVLAGLILRWFIVGRPPLASMYESIVGVALGVALLGALAAWIFRCAKVLAAAAVIAGAALLLADCCPAVLDSQLQQLPPELASNFWLIAHVLLMLIALAALTLSWGIGNITIYYQVVVADTAKLADSLLRILHQCLVVGVLLMTLAATLGAMWSERVWGQFWSWDPKEVWTLIVLLGYVAILHAAAAGYLGRRGLAASSVTAFWLVVVAWYGVNSFMQAGQHHFGFVDGPAAYVLLAGTAQFILLAFAIRRHYRQAGAQRRVPV